MKRLPIFIFAIVGAAIAAISVAWAANGGGPDLPPVNDRIQLATDLTRLELPTTDRIDATLATAGDTEPTHGGSPANATVWWRWNATVDGDMVVSSANTDNAATLVVYEGEGPPGLNQVVAGVGSANTGSTLSFNAKAGDTYWFVIDQKTLVGGATGEVELSLRHAGTLPANDDFANATQLTGRAATMNANSALATAEVNETDHAGEPPARSLWWTWTAPASGPVDLNTCGSVFDTVVSVTTGSSFGSLDEVAANDDIEDEVLGNCDTLGLGLSQAEFFATAGQEYNIAVDGFVGAAGPLEGELALGDADLRYVPIVPCVAFDSSSGATGTLAGPYEGGESRNLDVTGQLPAAQGGGGNNCGIPSTARAVSISLTALDPQRIGNLRVTAAGTTPLGGVVNFSKLTPRLENSNNVSVPIAADGTIDVSANGGPNGVGQDLAGVRGILFGYWVDPALAGLRYVPITPCAVFDSRTDVAGPAGGVFAGKYDVGETRLFDVVGSFNVNQGGGNTDCGIPTSADAVALNMVAVRAADIGSIAVAPGGTSPTEPIVNFANVVPPTNNSASVFVPLSSTGRVTVGVDGDPGDTEIVDVRGVAVGYLEPDPAPTNLPFNPVTPCAVADSRTTQGGTAGFAGPYTGGETKTIQVTGAFSSDQGGGNTDCGVPAGADAVLVNVVAVAPERVGNLRASATGTVPTGGIVNFGPLSVSTNNSNAVVIPLSASGEMDVNVNAGAAVGLSTVHVRVVVLGYLE